MTIEFIFSEYQTQVFNYVNWKLGNQHDAEDVTQAVFIKVNRLLKTFNADLSAFPTWLRNITNSVLIDFIRTNHSEKYKAVSDFVNSEGNNNFQFANPEKADQIMENTELSERLDGAFYNLNPEYRRIATMYFVHEYKYEEIAEILKIKLGTVKGMISRSREMLKNELKDLHKVKAKLEMA